MAKAAKNRWSKPKGKVHALLARAFPEHRTKDYDVFNVEWLATKLEMTEEGIYKWLREDRLPLKRARQIVKIRGCRISLDDLMPYVV